MKEDKQRERAMKIESRLVISGKLVPPARAQEDTFMLAKNIVEELTGQKIEKSQVGICSKYQPSGAGGTR